MVYIQLLLFFIQLILLVPVAYLLLLTAAAWRGPQEPRQKTTAPGLRFGVLIPAHNEERLLPTTLASLLKTTYPADLYDIHVVADNCTDHTAQAAAAFKVRVHERQNLTLVGKGHALNWCLQELHRLGQTYEAYVFVDADTEVAENFLEVMNSRLAEGAQVLQAYYAVKDPQISWNTSLRFAALAVLHYLRPMGRMVLGGSAGLKGNGMVFTAEVLAAHPWSGSITEDIEAHMALLLDGIPVQFAPGAVVWGEMPQTFDQSQSQLDRWEHGRLLMARKYVPSLVRAAGQALRQLKFRRAYLYLDAVMEHLIPPFSLLFASSALALAVSLGMFLLPNALIHQVLVWLNLFLAGGLVFGQIVYLLAGLRMVGAPAEVYRNLLFAPWFVVRKLGQFTRLIVQRGPQEWVKTTRNNG
jgi:cellulose synthase/poly-beta-1,6-N-acetylglucosamine synthase-like glycosyltransferase